MDLDDQSLILRTAQEHGNEVVVVLGQPDPDSAEMAAETVHNGDPTFAGPLAGVSLGLPVMHIFEDEVKGQIDPSVYEEQIGLLELALDTESVKETMKKSRGA